MLLTEINMLTVRVSEMNLGHLHLCTFLLLFLSSPSYPMPGSFLVIDQSNCPARQPPKRPEKGQRKGGRREGGSEGDRGEGRSQVDLSGGRRTDEDNGPRRRRRTACDKWPVAQCTNRQLTREKILVQSARLVYSTPHGTAQHNTAQGVTKLLL